MRLVKSRWLRTALFVVGVLGATACGDLPTQTQEARGLAQDANAVLVLTIVFFVVAGGIIVAAVALDRYVRSRRALAQAPPEPEPEEESDEETVAGIAQSGGRVPRWLYAAYILIPIWALAYVVNAGAIQDAFGPPEVEATPPPPVVDDLTRFEIAAESIAFDTDRFRMLANTEVTIVFENRDSVPHDVAIYTDEDRTEEIFDGEIFTGPATREYVFTSPDPGEYYFLCTVHPGMNGWIEFVDPAEVEVPDVDEEDTITVVAERIQFDVDEFTLPANTEVTIVFENRDSVEHDIDIYTDDTLTEQVFSGELFTGPATREYVFTSPDPGEYYFHCSVHPGMSGTAIFR